MSLRASSNPLLSNALRAGSRSSLVSARVLGRAVAANVQSNKSNRSALQSGKVSHFTTSALSRAEFESPFGINSLSKLTEEEEMLREAVRRFAQEVVEPKVREMDENEKMDPEVIKGLFEQGLMGIETSEELGGAGCSFTAAIIVIEGV
jgi:short/branched chain acyl-CoA dehydrogenase